jgi:hypothetical protein
MDPKIPFSPDDTFPEPVLITAVEPPLDTIPCPPPPPSSLAPMSIDLTAEYLEEP